jgi:phosphate transport system substrate-binding protein
MLKNLKGVVLGIVISGLVLSFMHCGKKDETGRAKVITGAGATFPYPLYAQWAHKFESINGVKLNYQSIGSGGGIAQIKAKTVDFGASDAPLESAELDSIGLIQFPMIIGGVVPVINLEGVAAGALRLTSELLAEIFLGNVKKWNDDRIQQVNTSLQLPAKDITVVNRADGSGTTWIFTNYLAKISTTWQEKVGFGKAVDWPVGVGGKGNEGVAAYVQRVDGAVGYVEYAYALQNKMTHVLLQNRDGEFVAATSGSFQAAAANADWQHARGYYLVLTDQPGKESWPITGASFILIHKQQNSMAMAQTMLEFFNWSFRHGGDLAEKLDYVPIPLNVVELVEQTWRDEVRVDDKPVWK